MLVCRGSSRWEIRFIIAMVCFEEYSSCFAEEDNYACTVNSGWINCAFKGLNVILQLPCSLVIYKIPIQWEPFMLGQLPAYSCHAQFRVVAVG